MQTCEQQPSGGSDGDLLLLVLPVAHTPGGPGHLPRRRRDRQLPYMRIQLFGAGKENTFSSPPIRITGSLQRPVQPFQGMSSSRFSAVDRAEPPIFRAVLVETGKQ